MPWKAEDVDRHAKGLSDHQKTVWVRVANSALKECGGGDECEGKAIRQANAVAKRAPKTATEAQIIPLDAALALISEAELSLDQKRQAVHNALRTQTTAALGTSCWIRDLYDDYVIYELEGPEEIGTYRRDYSIADDGAVTLGDAQRVRLVTSYEPVSESDPGPVDEAEDFISDLVPLIERALSPEGTLQIKVIEPDRWGSSGYYGREVLERDLPRIYPPGTHMYLDHPSQSEQRDRPERRLRDLAAVTVTAPVHLPQGPDGPGFYAEARPLANFAGVLDELAPHIGVSIRARGYAKPGEAAGRKGPVIERFESGESIDFVTKAGAGGKVLSLMESARPRPEPTEAVSMATDPTANAEMTALQESIKRLEEQNQALLQEQARQREANLLREAQDFVTTELSRYTFPLEETRRRLATQLTANPPTQEGALDRVAYATRIDEAAKAEIAYLARLTGSGQIRGMGGSEPASTEGLAEAEAALAEAMQGLGLSESAAKLAAAGR